MDFSSILKGASDTLKKLETDVSNVGKDIAPENPRWQGWDAGAEDDAWEDVADVAAVAPALEAKSPPDEGAREAANGASLPERDGGAVATATTATTPATAAAPVTPATPMVAAVAATAAASESDGATVARDEETVEGAGGAATGGDGAAEVASLRKQLKEALERASASERKVYAVTRDRDALRRIRDTRTGDAELVKEKDKQITAILGEGEKLSIKIAEKEKVVRALKTSLKERETAVEDLRVTLNATEAKLEATASRQRQLETSEKAAQDGMEAAERRLRQVEADARSKSSSSAALEAARAQLESLRKGQAAALENQAMRLRAEHEKAVAQAVENGRMQEESLNKAMMELRAHLTQVVDNAGWREDQLRKEVEELRKRAEQLEARNEELAAAMPDATRPLLRQVEALQAAASERVRAKSAVDRSQLEKFRAAKAEAAMAAEREKAAEERIGNLMTRNASLEEQVKIANMEQARISAELRALQAEEAELALKHQRELEASQTQLMKAARDKESVLDELTKERASHLDAIEVAEEKDRQHRAQLAKLEAKLEMVQESLAKATSANAQRGIPSSLSQPSTPLARFDSLANMSSASLGFGGSDFDDDHSILGEVSSPSAGVYATERLMSSLRQRNGEIASLQSQLDSKERGTEALAEEVVALTARVDELTKEKGDAPGFKKELDELKKRHTALLELLGEREERITELEADLSDVNQMYKEQITELLLRIEKMSG